jgi:hypothetical protein
MYPVRPRRSQLIAASIILASVAAGSSLTWLFSREVTLEFQVHDEVSGQWVWDATAVAEDREMRLYYQSDHGPKPQVFSRLTPGETRLEISAPSYITVSVPVMLRRGKNHVERPIELVGYEIPGLNRWIMFEEWVGNRIMVEMRPLDEDGRAVINHPSLDLWVAARISVQEGAPTDTSGGRRGAELFAGQIDWQWDSAPESLFRYTASIPAARIQPTSEPLWVIDYLVVVPDPRRVRRDRVQAIMGPALAAPADTIPALLESYERDGLFRSYSYTAWNVDGGAH